VISRLYYKFNLIKNGKNNFITLNKLTLNRMKAFLLSLDITFDYYSYDKLRQLFVLLSKNDVYVIPNERVALLEYKRILSDGLSNLVGKQNQSILSNPSLIINNDYFKDIEDKNDLSNFPIFISLYNHINNS